MCTCTPGTQTGTQIADPHLGNMSPPQITLHPFVANPCPSSLKFFSGSHAVFTVVWAQYLYLHHHLIHVFQIFIQVKVRKGDGQA